MIDFILKTYKTVCQNSEHTVLYVLYNIRVSVKFRTKATEQND